MVYLHNFNVYFIKNGSIDLLFLYPCSLACGFEQVVAKADPPSHDLPLVFSGWLQEVKVY